MPHRKRTRSTPQRRIVLEELRKVTSHPTAVELHGMVRHRLPRISLGTVYRNLELLAEQGVVMKLELGGAESRFDGNVAPHHHVRCVRCGRVSDVHGLPESMLREDVAKAAGYRIIGYRLEFIGVCPACRAQEE